MFLNTSLLPNVLKPSNLCCLPGFACLPSFHYIRHGQCLTINGRPNSRRVLNATVSHLFTCRPERFSSPPPE
jgi:hypothetical protein